MNKTCYTCHNANVANWTSHDTKSCFTAITEIGYHNVIASKYLLCVASFGCQYSLKFVPVFH